MEDKSLTDSTFSTETTEPQSDNYIDPALGAYIRKLRKDRGMSIRELAEAAGCSAAHVTRIELAQRRGESFVLRFFVLIFYFTCKKITGYHSVLKNDSIQRWYPVSLFVLGFILLN